MSKDSTKNPTLAPSSTEPKGSDSARAKVSGPKKGKLVKKTGNAKGGSDPYRQAKPSRTKTTATGGARYGIRVKFQKSVAPEAGATQSNGRLFTSRKVQAPDFKAGMSDLQ